MSNTATTASLAELIRKLVIGQRFWFWFCPELPITEARLVLSPIKSDSNMQGLKAQVAGIELPLGAAPIVGMLAVDSTGRLTFGSPQLSTSGLINLADWTRHHIEEHPELAVLKNALFAVFRPNGQIASRFESESLWSFIEEPPVVAGTAAYLSTLLARVRPGSNYWFWMSEHGPGSAPFLFLGPIKKDSDGRRFADRVLTFRRQSADTYGHQGVLRRREDGRLLFVINAEATADAQSALASLIRSNAELEGAQLAFMSGGSFQQLFDEVLEEEHMSFQHEAEVLAELTEGKVWFWFAGAEQAGNAVLLLDTDRGQLKSRARELEVTGAVLRGALKVSSKGWLEFQAKSAYPNFITELAAWTVHNVASTPGLSRLKGSRFTQRDDEGNIVDRQKNDASWASIN